MCKYVALARESASGLAHRRWGSADLHWPTLLKTIWTGPLRSEYFLFLRKNATFRRRSMLYFLHSLQAWRFRKNSRACVTIS